MSTAGPPPTILVKFSDLHRYSTGQKVRFLGCVTRYNAENGEVTLQNKSLSSKNKIVLVDVNLLLETLKTPETRIGEWVNVVGYVTKQELKESKHGIRSIETTSLQAIIYWSAGALKTEEYEEAVNETQSVQLAM